MCQMKNLKQIIDIPSLDILKKGEFFDAVLLAGVVYGCDPSFSGNDRSWDARRAYFVQRI